MTSLATPLQDGRVCDVVVWHGRDLAVQRAREPEPTRHQAFPAPPHHRRDATTRSRRAAPLPSAPFAKRHREPFFPSPEPAYALPSSPTRLPPRATMPLAAAPHRGHPHHGHGGEQQCGHDHGSTLRRAPERRRSGDAAPQPPAVSAPLGLPQHARSVRLLTSFNLSPPSCCIRV